MTTYLYTILQVFLGGFLLCKFCCKFETSPIHFIYQCMFIGKWQNLYRTQNKEVRFKKVHLETGKFALKHICFYSGAALDPNPVPASIGKFMPGSTGKITGGMWRQGGGSVFGQGRVKCGEDAVSHFPSQVVCQASWISTS